ncbi:glycosyltransferase [Magnetospirillum molischianum]|uniref:Glycosyl transferase group 1 n=1 Tax=Magnetospirillum molischianum DSM 120 TaxID=1150626 RepID=H8FQ91_MAGML|nr:glycosyltransferase [Magnetospirillum molischianum]CCG40529.1 Glycosyl transferase group 1 [Magnetospirillum molischianum DSM 120]
MSESAARSPVVVTHVITSLGSGGAEGVLARLAATPGSVRHRVISLIDDGIHGAALRAQGVSVTTLGMNPGRPMPGAWLALIRELRRARPDIVMTWLYHADLMGTVATLLAGRPILVWNVRCSNMDLSRYSRLTGWIVRLLARASALPRLVVANSNAGKIHHQSLGYHPREWATIPNGFDLPDLASAAVTRHAVRSDLGLADDDIVIGMIARADPMKNHPGFLAAAAWAAAIEPRLRFVLIGRGTDDPHFGIVSEIDRLGVRDRTCVLGERRDVGHLLNGLDSLVSASTFGEGLSNAIGEAMAAAVPCIVTDVGDAAILVAETGFVVPPADDQALGEAILRMARLSSAGRAALGEAARTRIQERYSMAKMIADYEALFIRLAEQAG